MKVVIEALGLSSDGTKPVASGVLSRLGNHPQHHFTLILPGLPEYQLIAAPNVSVHFISKTRGLLSRDMLLNRCVPQLCRDQHADVLLCMGSFLPRRLPCRTAVLLHLPYVVYREPSVERRLTIRDRLRVNYGRWLYRRLPQEVSVIVQIEAVKRRVMQLYGIRPERIFVIPNAVPPFQPYQSASPEGRDRHEPFQFLCFGHYPHKNIEIIFAALKRLPRYTSGPAQCSIVISAEQQAYARRLQRNLEQSGGGSSVVCMEPVNREKVPELYQSADAYILPTLMETFSFTYDEAMHFGLPILTSDRDFAHERCQDAALYFDPLDADSVAGTMAKVMGSEELRRQLAENGRRVLAKELSWDDIASRFVDALERVANSSERST